MWEVCVPAAAGRADCLGAGSEQNRSAEAALQQECVLVLYVPGTEESCTPCSVSRYGIQGRFVTVSTRDWSVMKRLGGKTRNITSCWLFFPPQVVEYAIHLHTGDLKKADATGEAYLCIQGEKGDSGKRWLNSRNSLITFARGQVRQ